MHSTTQDSLQRFNYLFGETDALYHELALKLGLSDSAMKILYVICDTGEPCLLREICRRSGLSKQTLNSALRKLEEEGTLFLESAGPRSKQVRLTPAGRALADHTAREIIRMENAVFAGWPEQDVQTYLTLTERFLTDLRARGADMGLLP